MAVLGIRTREYIEFDPTLLGRKVKVTVHKDVGGEYQKTNTEYVGIVTSVAPSDFVFCYRTQTGDELNFKTITADSLLLPANKNGHHAQLFELEVGEVVL